MEGVLTITINRVAENTRRYRLQIISCR